jgi:ATP-dependent DNA ligase
VVDGEIVVMSEGTPNFQARSNVAKRFSVGEIKRQSQRAPAVYIVFDIIEKAGKD